MAYMANLTDPKFMWDTYQTSESFRQILFSSSTWIPQIRLRFSSTVTALYKIKMHLTDDNGVLNGWKDNQMTPCDWEHVKCQDNKVTTM